MPPAKQKYIRNLMSVPIGVRLGTGRRIDLKPRGQRGDCAPVSRDEMTDQIFLGNVDAIFHLVTEEEAKAVIEKQTTNQQRVHPALAQMRNEKGEEYTRGVVVQENYQDQGVVVAQVTDKDVMITRVSAPGSVDNPIAHLDDSQDPQELEKRSELNEGLGGLKVVKNQPNTPS